MQEEIAVEFSFVAYHLLNKQEYNKVKFLLFAELRKGARQLENELEMKLVSFSKLGNGQLRDFGREGYGIVPNYYRSSCTIRLSLRVLNLLESGYYMCMYVYNYLTWTTLYNQREISINSGPALEKERQK